MAGSEPRPDNVVRRTRQNRRLRQVDVAERAGIAVSYVSMIENGLVPPVHVRERIGKALGRTPERLWPEVGA